MKEREGESKREEEKQRGIYNGEKDERKIKRVRERNEAKERETER